MNTKLHLHPIAKGWLFESDLAPYVDAFIDYLRQGRYANKTTRTYLGCIAHIARWISQCHLIIEQLDEAAMSRFLGDHLPHCDCPPPACRSYKDLHAVCGHLLRVLRDGGAVAPSPRFSPGRSTTNWSVSTNTCNHLRVLALR